MLGLPLGFILAIVILVIALHLGLGWIPKGFKQYVWRPLVKYLWKKPIQSKGVLFCVWSVYCLLVVGSAIHLFWGGKLSFKTILILVLLGSPVVTAKALLNYRERRR